MSCFSEIFSSRDNFVVRSAMRSWREIDVSRDISVCSANSKDAGSIGKKESEISLRVWDHICIPVNQLRQIGFGLLIS